MIYGEVGKLPLQVSVHKQQIAYWFRVLNKDVHTFAYKVYMIAYIFFRRDEYKSQWVKRVKYILDSCGLSISGTINTQFLPNRVRLLYIDELKILHCKNGILMFLLRQCVECTDYLKNNLISKTISYIQITEIEFHYQSRDVQIVSYQSTSIHTFMILVFEHYVI